MSSVSAMLLLSCILFFVLTLFNYSISGRKLTYPPFIFCALWLFLFVFRIIFTQFYLKDYYPVLTGTYLLFMGGGIVTTLAGYIVLLQNSVAKFGKLNEFKNSTINTSIANINTYNTRMGLTLLIILLFPFYIKFITAIVVASEVENIFKSIRYETAVEGQTFGIYSYVITFAAFLSLLNGYFYWQHPTKNNRNLYIISLVLAIAYAICTMGRTPVLTAIAFNIALYVIASKRIRLFRLIRYAFLFCVLFIIMGVLMDKGGDLNSSFTENVNSGVEGLGLYITSPMNALNEVLHGRPHYTYGARTFRFFYVLLNSLRVIRIDENQFNLVDDFLFVPYPVNVYTFYNPYVRDFGVLFSLLSLFLFMVWHSWAFVKSIKNQHVYFPKLTYCFLFYPLLMTIFNDQYASLFSSWLQLYCFAGLFYGYVLVLKYFKRQNLVIA